MKTGLFGGTFNPVHLGHIRVAGEIAAGLGFDQIVLIPSALPPHKTSQNLASATDRLEMATIAAQGHARLSVSDIEYKRSGPSYSIDTVKYFKSILPENSEISFITGIDAFLEIHTWKSYMELLREISFVVMTRPDGDLDMPGGYVGVMHDYINKRISSGYTSGEDGFSHPALKPVHLFETSLVDISSTMIRDRIKKGLSVKGLLPEGVSQYIKSKGLYL